METKMSSHGTGLPLLSSNNSVSALSRHPILAMAFHVLRFVGGHVPLRQLGEHVDDPPGRIHPDLSKNCLHCFERGEVNTSVTAIVGESRFSSWLSTTASLLLFPLAHQRFNVR